MYDQKILNPSTRCWAQGMDGWRSLSSVPQLKWSLCATGQPILNDSDLCITCLNMLISICKFYPNRYKFFHSFNIHCNQLKLNLRCPSILKQTLIKKFILEHEFVRCEGVFHCAIIFKS